jgi:formamidopyrimidine-DNA glycosylase
MKFEYINSVCDAVTTDTVSKIINISTDVPQPYNKIGDGPEGPEVKTVAETLKPIIVNKIITKIDKNYRAVTLGFENIKLPCIIKEVTSYGKKILIHLDNKLTIVIYLGMEGKIVYEQTKHSHVSFEICNFKTVGSFNVLTDKFIIYFDDSRLMGGVDIIPTHCLSYYFSTIGIDLMSACMSEDTWIPIDIWVSRYKEKSNLNVPIVDALKDQSIFTGIGNIYRSECLYYAGIDPLRKVSTLTDDEWETLRQVVHKILNLAVSLGGCTVDSFVSPDGQLGGYQPVIYQKDFDPQGYKVVAYKKHKSAQTVYYCPTVQF